MFEKSLIMELVHGVSVDNNVCTAEKKISINFTKAKTKFSLSLVTIVIKVIFMSTKQKFVNLTCLIKTL